MADSKEMEALRAELAALDAQLEPIEAAAEARAQAEAMRLEVETKKHRLRDEPHITKAEEEHGPIGTGIAVVDTRLGAIVLKRPNHLLVKKYTSKKEASADDMQTLIRVCVVYPEKAQYDAIVEELPGVIGPLAEAMTTLVGAHSKARAGKSKS